jgi:preprotein translocase subunit YajC
VFPRNLRWHRERDSIPGLYVSARVVIVIFALILIVFWFFIGWDNARHSAFPQRGRGRFQGSFLFLIIIIKASYFLVKKRNELRKDGGGG